MSMKSSFIVVFCLLFACTQAQESPCVCGKSDSFPWVVQVRRHIDIDYLSFQEANPDDICDGVLISAQYILTANQCNAWASPYWSEVTIGGETRTLKEYTHFLNGRITIIKLDRPVNTTEIPSICISDDEEYPADVTPVWAHLSGTTLKTGHLISPYIKPVTQEDYPQEIEPKQKISGLIDGSPLMYQRGNTWYLTATWYTQSLRTNPHFAHINKQIAHTPSEDDIEYHGGYDNEDMWRSIHECVPFEELPPEVQEQEQEKKEVPKKKKNWKFWKHCLPF